jgi:hypothetical protein
MRFLLVVLIWVSLSFAPAYSQTALIDTAKRYVGVREKTGHNDGYFVEMFQNFVGIPKYSSYCGAFVSYCLTKAHAIYPRTRSGSSRAFKKESSIKSIDVFYGARVPAGSLVGFELVGTANGHIEITTKDNQGATIETIGANTSNGLKGSQYDGNGVYARIRRIVPYGQLPIKWFTLVKY